MNESAKQPAPKVPEFDQKRYTHFYKTMLILSTIGTTLALVVGLLSSLPAIMRYLGSEPLYAYALIVDLIAVIGAAVALIFLWQKRSFGILLKLSAYVITLISIGLFFMTAHVATDEFVKEFSSQPDTANLITPESAELFVQIGHGFSAVVVLVFAVLWWFAWKGQVKADRDRLA